MLGALVSGRRLLAMELAVDLLEPLATPIVSIPAAPTPSATERRGDQAHEQEEEQEREEEAEEREAEAPSPAEHVRGVVRDGRARRGGQCREVLRDADLV